MVIHERYLPFTREQMLQHFTNQKRLDKLEVSALRHLRFMARNANRLHGMSINREVRNERQTERDERFWTACTLKTLYDNNQMCHALQAAFGDTPPVAEFGTWANCLGDREDQFLLFEVGLTSPKDYRASLRQRFAILANAAHPTPYVVDAAAGPTEFEGPTRCDALLGNRKNEFRVIFESKLLCDISCEVQFDPRRNQLARNLDVLLDDGSRILGKKPGRRLLCLLTPRLFFDDRSARYYGLLYDAYKSDHATLTRHLPHRDNTIVEQAVDRLGWLTFEQCHQINPAACPWMQPA